MSTVAEIKALLVATGKFGAVLGATSYAQIKGNRPDAVLPAVYVLVTEETSAENSRATGRVMQRTERDIALVHVVEHLGDADGADVVDPLEDIKATGRAALIGFKPTDMVEVITHVHGEVLEAGSGIVWFADTFSAPIYLKETT